MPIYVGQNVNDPHHGIVFEYYKKPTMETHGYGCGTAARFDCVIGPFQTEAGAQYMAENGYLNPLCQTVQDAEKLARKDMTT